MTHYDKLIDTITDVLYHWYVSGASSLQWDDASAKKDAHNILEVVEEFQNNRFVNLKQWRASD